MLKAETNKPSVYRSILKSARKSLKPHKPLQADFEHEGWFITCVNCGAQWSVNDAQNINGEFYFQFDEITNGDENCF
jgi:hypothetical protein